MAKLVAKVRQVLVDGIHSIATVEDGDIRKTRDLPLPNRVVIEMDDDPEGPCMLFRYTTDDEFCGDTWHEDLDSAIDQANYEYGLVRADFSESLA